MVRRRDSAVERTMLRIAARTMQAGLQQRGLHPSRRRFAAPQDEEIEWRARF